MESTRPSLPENAATCDLPARCTTKRSSTASKTALSLLQEAGHPPADATRQAILDDASRAADRRARRAAHAGVTTGRLRDARRLVDWRRTESGVQEESGGRAGKDRCQREGSCQAKDRAERNDGRGKVGAGTSPVPRPGGGRQGRPRVCARRNIRRSARSSRRPAPRARRRKPSSRSSWRAKRSRPRNSSSRPPRPQAGPLRASVTPRNADPRRLNERWRRPGGVMPRPPKRFQLDDRPPRDDVGDAVAFMKNSMTAGMNAMR